MPTSDEHNNVLEAPSQRILGDYVANQLRQAILIGHFKPNQRLVEQDIAESMETSRGPIRDALLTLEKEGLVIRQPYRGAFVAQLNPEDMMEIYTLREVLESLAMKYIIKKGTLEQIRELKKIVHKMENLAEKDYSQMEATDLDMEFHHTLCKISGHKRVLIAWKALSAQIRIVLWKHLLEHPTDLPDRFVTWHTKIVDALCQRDYEKAVKEMHIHMSVSMDWVDQLMAQKGQQSQD